MNVFVLSTGRTGSLSLERACRHLTNFTVCHESRCELTGSSRLNFPDQHIEIDNRLSWFLGRLDEKYGDNAVYIHMIRNRQQVARSYTHRWNRETGIIRAYAYGILKRQEHHIGHIENICLDYYDTVNENIRLFLKDKTRVQTFELSNAEADLEKFWGLIGAQGDFQAARAAFFEQHNRTSSNIKEHSALGSKILRILKKFPSYIRNA